MFFKTHRERVYKFAKLRNFIHLYFIKSLSSKKSMKFDFSQPIKLENERVILRPLEQNDFTYLLPFSENEGDLWNYSLTPAAGAKNLQTYIDTALVAKDKLQAYPFVVFDKKTQKIAGSTRFYDIQITHNVLSLGYTWYGKEFQRTGLNRNCKYLLLSYAFDTLGVDRVEFRADLRNVKSIQAMKQIGCTQEGILRSNCSASNGRRDSIVLSILKPEWNQQVKTHLQSKLY
jgi:RimJ/RimL family protein N-acetyltransferase|tara:strand:- start:1101 stop:1793 length:693 start_codon:yes stop_codon:yes gene_type:complete